MNFLLVSMSLSELFERAYIFDDVADEVENCGLHEELDVLPAGVVLFDVPAPLLMVVVSPEDHLLLLVELDKCDPAHMEVVILAVPDPLACLADALLKQLQANAVLEDDLPNSRDAPNRMEDISGTQYRGT